MADGDVALADRTARLQVAAARQEESGQGIARLPQYVAAYLAVLGANMAAMRGLIVLGLVPALAQALLLVPMAALAFVLVSLALTGRLPFGRTR